MKYLTFLIVILFSAIGIQYAFSEGDKALASEKQAEEAALVASQSPIFAQDITDGTLLTTANDTFTQATRLISLWTYNHTFDLTATGAMTVHAVLQENNEPTAGQWYEVERDTVVFSTAGTKLSKLDGSLLSYANTGATINENTTLGYVKGQRQRLILDIVTNAGSDTLTFDGDWTFKK